MTLRLGVSRILYAFLILVATLVSSANAALVDRVTERTLQNGLKVILLENHKAPLITFQVWYRVGSRNEQLGLTGLSHMLEHMMFKGTEKISGAEFSRIIEQNGGNENAFTSTDFTAYFENMSADKIHIPIQLESDRMGGILLKEEDFKTERAVVMEERRLRTDDSPKAVLLEQLQATAFQLQPYRWPIIGWMQDIARYTIDDLRAYHSTYYNPSNALVVVLGDFNTREALSLIEQAFGPLPEGPKPNQERNHEQPQLGERRIMVRKEAQLASVIKAYHVPNLKDPDSYVLEVISAILSAGKSSRLYRTLVQKKQLALAAESENELVSRDPGLFILAADVMPGKSVDQVEKALEEEIEGLRKRLVGARELTKAKNQLESMFIYGQDSLFYQGMLLAGYEIVSSWRDADRYVPAIKAVSAKDIQRVTRKYLLSWNCTTALLIPSPTTEKKVPHLGSPVKENLIR
jgi:zinc protease